MPGYRAHLIGGIVAYGVTVYLLQSYCTSLFLATEWFLFALAGSLFPDIDTKSKGQHILYKFIAILLIILALERQFAYVAVISVASMVPIVVRHRGLFHRFWFVIGFPLSAAFAISFYVPSFSRVILFDALFFIVGALSHLFLDFGLKK